MQSRGSGPRVGAMCQRRKIPSRTMPAFSITRADAGFSPARLTVNQGGEVFWFNDGSEVHSANATSGEWNSGRIQPLDYYSTFLTRTGSFAYVCSQHNGQYGLSGSGYPRAIAYLRVSGDKRPHVEQR